ncbi:hypothetical protein EUZ85_14305 [Hahella sp. KA22]|uniref:hypothetical protein n=1 Tax=Hahella sp. KA22 TaxID=1628392 RepID=UPI000FDE138D|nr:hypothetical protein [Hahella sp. KA22]AZZ91838.1 hypothetical protein ENC22_11740 [Hahella sp. KA22]QAY55209.1 hypothetical protein EUZ85_14305 [Hahella sp. KA22]
MANLIRCESLSNPDFNVQIIEHEGRTWIRLSDSEFKKFFGFWSTQNLNEYISLSDVVKEISRRLQGVDKGSNISVKDAISYWPDGWDYWSLGVPAPLANYINYEFKDDLEKLI